MLGAGNDRLSPSFRASHPPLLVCLTRLGRLTEPHTEHLARVRIPAPAKVPETMFRLPIRTSAGTAEVRSSGRTAVMGFKEIRRSDRAHRQKHRWHQSCRFLPGFHGTSDNTPLKKGIGFEP
jgi:hypothetical protein